MTIPFASYHYFILIISSIEITFSVVEETRKIELFSQPKQAVVLMSILQQTHHANPPKSVKYEKERHREKWIWEINNPKKTHVNKINK